MMTKDKTYYSYILDRIFDEVTNEIDSKNFFDNDVWAFSDDKKEDDTSALVKPFSSTIEFLDIPFRFIERRVVNINAENEENERKKLINDLFSKLEKSLDLFEFESESMSVVEKEIIDIENKYNMGILGEVLQFIYMRHFNEPKYLVGICSALLRYDFDEVKPWGVAMISGLINHPDERVKESTIELIDNWSDTELLPILNTLQVSSEWMRAYIDKVVANLENKCSI